jgi:hypothetical protein
LATHYLKSQVFIRTIAFLGVTGRDKERNKRSEKRNRKEDRHGEKNGFNDVQYKQTKMLVTKGNENTKIVQHHDGQSWKLSTCFTTWDRETNINNKIDGSTYRKKLIALSITECTAMKKTER